MADIQRQSFPVGDSENGQLVQNRKPLTVNDLVPNWVGFTQVTVSTTAVTLGTLRGSANRAFITVESNPIRFTLDDTVPTASVGHLLPVGSTLSLNSAAEVFGFQAIRQGGADGTISVTFGVA